MPGDSYMLTMNAGDVVELVGAWAKDPQTRNATMSGTIVKANKDHFVQVISFNAISQLPDVSVANADHMEETVLPAKFWAKNTSSRRPPRRSAIASVTSVRIYGTRRRHPAHLPRRQACRRARHHSTPATSVQIPAMPTGQPAAQCIGTADHCMLNTPFVVEGDKSFAVASFMVGGVLQMPGTDATTSQGDPSFSMEVTPEQFRKEYTFLAPVDYMGKLRRRAAAERRRRHARRQGHDRPRHAHRQQRLVDDAPHARLRHRWRSTSSRPITNKASASKSWASASRPRYYYPGGLNLERISDPPVVVVK